MRILKTDFVLGHKVAAIECADLEEACTLDFESLRRLDAVKVRVEIKSWDESDGLQQRLLDRFGVSKIGYSMRRRDLSVQALSAAPLLTAGLATASELEQLIEYTYTDAITGRMSCEAGRPPADVYSELLGIALSGQVLVLREREAVEGFCILRDLVQGDETMSLVAWIWRRANTDLRVRGEFKLRVQNFLTQVAREKLFATIHRENLRSRGFFRSIGFWPTCFFVLVEGLGE